MNSVSEGLVAEVPQFTNVIFWVNADANLPSAVLPRIWNLLNDTLLPGGISSLNTNETLTAILPTITNHEQTLLFCIGSNDCTNTFITNETFRTLGSESFHIRSHQDPQTNLTILAVNGENAYDTHESHHANSMRWEQVWSHGNRGLAYGVYAGLEELGFAFLHPLAPAVPPSISLANTSLALDESPRWKKFRTIHYHTQHPLELTPFLQGFGPGGVSDESGWEAQLPEFASFCEWLVANRQNGIEWPLLEGHTWIEFARSDTRIKRFKAIVDTAHSYGIMVGVDVPIAFAQQHSFRLLRKTDGDDAESKAEIEKSLDWVMQAGFDFLGSESGTSEFTHSSPQTMINWMNYAADYATEKYNITMFMKVHCSSGQTADGFIDERTGQNINFNMLPHFASPNLGVLPHTVEEYSLDDPAPTYGNSNFTFIRDYLGWEVENGTRPVAFYPETAYWVSVDIDVPLFMPIYFERRLHDLRLLAADEDGSVHKNRMDGQIIFASGWEWSYWLNDAMAARAAWNPFVEVSNETDALRLLLRPLVRNFPIPQLRKQALDLIVEWTTVEKDLLIYGNYDGSAETENTYVYRQNGHAYLEGWDTWDDISKLIGKLTQPDRLGPVQFKQSDDWFNFWNKEAHNVNHEYTTEVRPLLFAMDAKLADLSARTSALALKSPLYLRDLWDDIADSARMTALRAHHMLSLYEYIYETTTTGENKTLASEAVSTINLAQAIVNAREKRYRVDANRIASWTGSNAPQNPTAYAFNYLWTVRSLHYWWRDTAKALINGPATDLPPFANIINPAEVGLGDGMFLNAALDIENFLSMFGIGKNLFDVAEIEPHYPKDIPGWVNP